MTNTQKLQNLRDYIFTTDNTACFIEREDFLHSEKMAEYYITRHDYHANVLAGLLDSVSTPIDENDIFVGRVVEGVNKRHTDVPSRTLAAKGHMSPNYEKVLGLGLCGIVEESRKNAERLGDEKSEIFYKNGDIVAKAIKRFAARYADAAEAVGMREAAKALRIVPYEPAYDFYSALQGIWIIHMIASCYVGSRDYAFGKFDEYMLPYYNGALKAGKTQEELEELLAGFFIKANEICGRASWNYKQKPILSQSSKQYVNIGGEHPNELSKSVLRAACIANMPQPEITVLLCQNTDADFEKCVFESLEVLTDKVNVYSYDLIKKYLLRRGMPEEIAKDFTFSACSTFDINHRNIREEYFAPTLQLFIEVLNDKCHNGISEIVNAFSDKLFEHLSEHVKKVQKPWSFNNNKKLFVLDGLLIGDCTKNCRYPMDGGLTYHIYNMFCPGIATIADSLGAIDRLVFKEKRYTYEQYMGIVNANFTGHDMLRSEVKNFTKYGNDSEADMYATLAGNAFINAVERLKLEPNRYAIPGFYSLDKDNKWKKAMPATPDGRVFGEPISENQSPTYGADKNGITSLLNSVSKLPLKNTATGALNVMFANSVDAEILRALTKVYFENGGLHIGISVAKREELIDAMAHPEKYPALTVRLYGFSEYFVNMPPWQQEAILNRTAY